MQFIFDFLGFTNLEFKKKFFFFFYFYFFAFRCSKSFNCGVGQFFLTISFLFNEPREKSPGGSVID